MGQFVQGGNFGCLMSFKKEEDDFPFFGSSLAHLEPDLELFEVDAIGNDGDDDLSYHYHPNFKQLLLGF